MKGECSHTLFRNRMFRLSGFLPCRCMASNPMKNIWYCPMPEVCTPFATRKGVVYELL